MYESIASLSWSAILAGWPSGTISISDIRKLAEEKIIIEDGESLIPLSEISSVKDNADSADVEEYLVRLASLEYRPSVFGSLEWSVFRTELAIKHLEEVVDPDEPELNSYYRMRALEDVWRDIGEPLDFPLLVPFLRSYGEFSDAEGGINITMQELGNWIKQQKELLNVVSKMLILGQKTEVKTLAEHISMAQTNAKAYLKLAQDERAIYQRLFPAKMYSQLWQEVSRHNVSRLLDRRGLRKSKI